MSMEQFPFDPNDNKVTNCYGGYDPNEKGITQYPKFYEGPINSSDCSFQNPFPARDQTSKRSNVFGNPILDSVTRHYRRFIQDPGLYQPLDHPKGRESPSNSSSSEFLSKCENNPHFQESSSCCPNIKSQTCSVGRDSSSSFPPLQKPVDPVHWKPDLFDTSLEKYYLRNVLEENPYREFLSSYAEAATPLHYVTEYNANFSGNPTVETSSLGIILGLSRPTDITETCDWKRNRTGKLRDVIFNHKKDLIDSHLDYNDPKRYNPWGRHLAGHAALLEPNYRPRPGSGVEFNVTTVLPAVSPHSRQWII